MDHHPCYGWAHEHSRWRGCGAAEESLTMCRMGRWGVARVRGHRGEFDHVPYGQVGGGAGAWRPTWRSCSTASLAHRSAPLAHWSGPHCIPSMPRSRTGARGSAGPWGAGAGGRVPSARGGRVHARRRLRMARAKSAALGTLCGTARMCGTRHADPAACGPRCLVGGYRVPSTFAAMRHCDPHCNAAVRP
jgi:hypothetical protein